jgi:hypothetical protein
LEDIKEKEPEFYNRVIAVLKRAENDFGLWHFLEEYHIGVVFVVCLIG